MRELNECKAEILRRSEKRIKDRKRKLSRVLAACVPMCLVFVLCAAFVLPSAVSGDSDNLKGADGTLGTLTAGGEVQGAIVNTTHDYSVNSGLGSYENFSFSLTWGCYGISSYDSVTGKLVKTTDATNPEDYITTYFLTDGQKRAIYDLIAELDVTDYPSKYDPHNGTLASDPSMTLILSVSTDTVQKTVSAKDIALTYEAKNGKGQKFLDACKAIKEILTQTDEWKALPEYEFFYS